LRLWRTRFRWGWGRRAVDEKLDGRLAQALMSVQAVKGVRLVRGSGGGVVRQRSCKTRFRTTRRLGDSGGRQSGWCLEGEITNGEDVVIRDT